MINRPVVQGVTVDASKARDLDDAFWVERIPAGYRLVTTVADVASLVPIGSVDDDLAAARGLTVYSGTSAKAAMLNVQIAQGLASLLPGRERPAVACIVDLDLHGDILGQDFVRATVSNRATMSYEQFDEIFYRGEDPLEPMVNAAVDLARTLWRRRVSATGLPDWEAAFDEDGNLREDIPYGSVGQTVVHEFMVATNACATEFIRACGLPMIYRNQGPRPGGPAGRYELVCHGHANLGKAAYGQFTSPIRRFTDLVNQRILCAAIDSEPAPYDIPQLTYICAASNRATQRAEVLNRAKAESSSHKPRAETAPIDRLDAIGFRNTLEQAGGFDGTTRREFVRRVNDGLLTHSDVAWLLFGDGNVADDDLKNDILRRLTGNPEEMARIWECAFNEQSMPMFEAQIQPFGGKWIAAAAVGKHVGDAVDPDPVRARGLAVVRLAAEVAGVEPPMDVLPPGPGLRLTDTLSKAKLVALCRLMNWDGPEYTVEAAGVVGRHHYRGTATVRVNEFDYESPVVHASTRKGAEAAAATLALTALDPYADELLGRDARMYGVDLSLLEDDEAAQRPLSAITDFCRRYNAGQRIIWRSERPSICRFECDMEISADENTLCARGVGETRTEAMEAAAREAIRSLLSIGRRPEATVGETDVEADNGRPVAAVA